MPKRTLCLAKPEQGWRPVRHQFQSLLEEVARGGKVALVKRRLGVGVAAVGDYIGG